MWNLKRVILLLLGVVLFVSAYVVYNRVLGGIDGLPPLPQSYYASTEAAGLHHVRGSNSVEEKLQQAFGAGCKEQRWTIRLLIQPRGLLLAADDFKITPDGRVRLKPLHIALFSKSSDPDQFPEINTLEADEAYLKFEQPITNYLDMGHHKLVSAELIKNVTVRNNRRTPALHDDLVMLVPNGSVFYEDSNEGKQHIWTRDAVLMRDEQSQPEPMVVQAKGMDIFLLKELPGAKAANLAVAKQKSDNSGSIERIVLRSLVKMTLFPDADSEGGFLNNGSDNPKSGKPQPPTEKKSPGVGADAKHLASAGKPREKAKLLIETEGSFVFVVAEDLARFEKGTQNGFLEQIKVTRSVGDSNKGGGEVLYDQLYCDHLLLKFRPRTQPQPHTSDVATQQLGSRELEWVQATGDLVTITSDAQESSANGTFFLYDAEKHMTTLRSDQPEGALVKKGETTNIRAPEIQLISDKDGSRMSATGPGFIETHDKTASAKKPLKATWRGGLKSSRDEGRDCYHLTGGARFEDQQTDPPRILEGDEIKVWLDDAQARPKPAPAAATPNSAGPDQQARRLNKIEVNRNVRCQSPELRIEDANYLLVIFKDPPPDSAGVSTSNPAAPSGVPAFNTTAAPKGSGSGSAAATGAAAKPPQNPLQLSASSITATFIRCEARNDLENLWCKDKVHVHQEPPTKDDKPVDITGDDLQLKHYADGNWLHVAADPTTGNIAHLALNKIQIAGPQVTIDQRTNHVDVSGKGAMVLESTMTLTGDPVTKPSTVPPAAPRKPSATPPKSYPVVIYWEDRMDFNGRLAIFSGYVVAEQKRDHEESHLACQRLDVNLDKAVSLKEGEKKGESPTIKDLNCVQQVTIEDAAYDLNDRLIKYQRIECPELELHNDDGRVNASGKGVLRLWQPGGAEEASLMMGPAPPSSSPHPGQPATPVATPVARPAKDKKPENKLTRIEYGNNMWADRKQNIVRFYGGVEVYNVPTSNKDLPINPAKLPPGCFLMRSENLEVLGRAEGVRKYQYMHGLGRVQVQSPELYGRAADVTYDEEKDQFVFTGEPGNSAQVTKIDPNNPHPAQPTTMSARKIIYERRTGTMHGEQIDSVQGGPR